MLLINSLKFKRYHNIGDLLITSQALQVNFTLNILLYKIVHTLPSYKRTCFTIQQDNFFQLRWTGKRIRHTSFHAIRNTINLWRTATTPLHKAKFYETMLFSLMHFSFFILNFLSFYALRIAFALITILTFNNT
ncbi:hypothetical protein GGR08_000236 [Bartonella fuyuanensis]|uniref:Uncharacterized protein n=1 Tax=Bartonella fuyuanensis TaxID=1460968 RepID=A0A840DWP5_9HYPH|nr:hypothetical protein [Bartonella fuyuanensis]